MTLSRRALFGALGSATALAAAPRAAFAFGEEGAFHTRMLVTGGGQFGGVRATAPARWSWELVRRTSAPARLTSSAIAADDPRLHDEPFAIWAGEGEVQPLTRGELRGLGEYLRLGGVLFVDDNAPASGAFGKSVRRELLRALPDAAVVPLDPKHVIYKSYYIIERPVGRVLGPPTLDAIVRGKNAQVVFSSHDLLGALARSGETWALEVEPGEPEQRQHAIRLAVNLAMYVLCSDYKDDQVHAPWLMRRRARNSR